MVLLALSAINCRGTQPDIAHTPTPTTPAVASLNPTPATSTNNGWWQPAPGLTWQWQLGDDPIDSSIPAAVYDLDCYTDPEQVAALHRQGIRLIGYLSVGSWEEWRPDADQFPPEVLGKVYAGWSDEKWLDIRRIDLLAPIMLARLDLCKTNGFDAIEPDNIDIYTNDTGFPIKAADQIQYARWLAEEAHSRGLAIALKNAPEQALDLVNDFDFAITEDCFDQDWCESMLPFIQSGKAVFAAEYTDTSVDFPAACAWGQAHKFSFILKNRELDAWIENCP